MRSYFTYVPGHKDSRNMKWRGLFADEVDREYHGVVHTDSNVPPGLGLHEQFLVGRDEQTQVAQEVAAVHVHKLKHILKIEHRKKRRQSKVNTQNQYVI